MIRYISTTLFLAMSLITGCATFGNNQVDVDSKWKFIKEDVPLTVDASNWETVDVPHTYNAVDASNGGGKDMRSRDGYYRGPAWYVKNIHFGKELEGKRVFIRFEAVSSVANVYINGRHLGEHKGAFGAFCYELTDWVKFGANNEIRVKADNTFRPDVAPLSGDFPVFGGMYRPVTFLVKEQSCITPLDYGSPGVYVTQTKVSKKSADVEVLTKISTRGPSKKLTLSCIIEDAGGKVIGKNECAVSGKEVHQKFTLSNPRLWHGRKDPYLYTVKLALKEGETVIDSSEQPLGLRYFHVDKDTGFYLNGESYMLYGVNRHQDKKGKGWAISHEDQDLDYEMIMEMGSRAVRLAHYPHASYFYSLCDKGGLLVWAELPLVDCITDDPGFAPNATEQLIEMVRQNYNHPSIFCWSLFNEMFHRRSTDAIPLLKNLNTLTKKEDPTRLTVGGTNRTRKDLCNITDLLAFNGYPGWYGGGPGGMGGQLNSFNNAGEKRGIAVSEYGAGASAFHHQHGHRTKPNSRWHPEEWQAIVHEENYRTIQKTAYCWGSFVWNMFDFASVWRDEGDELGKNDKGLVSYDRTLRKDAFFFYKANWSEEPVLHLNAKRYTIYNTPTVPVKGYSNAAKVTLTVNGKVIGSAIPDAVKIVKWKDVKLVQGENQIELSATHQGKVLNDHVVWIYDPDAPTPGPAPIVIVQGRFSASHMETGNPPKNAFDGNADTRWAADQNGAWVSEELEKLTTANAVAIQWYKGSKRNYSFKIQTSIDGKKWRTVYQGTSGKKNDFEIYPFDQPHELSHYRVVCEGHSGTSWNSIIDMHLEEN